MPQVYYWRDIIGDSALFAPYKAEIDQLLAGEYASLSLEKLTHSTQPPIYSIRVNIDTRILFTTYQGKACLLDVVLNHDYHKSRFLRNPGVLAAFLTTLSDVAPAGAEAIGAMEDFRAISFAEIDGLSDEGADDSDMVPLEYYQQRLIRLTLRQNEALSTRMPAIIYGLAGSGKTCVALSMLTQYVREHDTGDAFSVLYVSRSPYLVARTATLWQEMNPDGARPRTVEFRTYDEVLKAHLDRDLSLADASIFNPWYNRYSKKHQEASAAGRAAASRSGDGFEAEAVWREFRIRSGYTELEYLDLGHRQSAYDKGERAFICAAFTAYTAYLSSTGMISAELHPLGRDGTYPLVVVDEAQDLSYGQLDGLNRLSGGAVVYLLGDHQVLYDGKSRLDYLRWMFHQRGQRASEIQLPVTYRCSEHVISVANKLIELKYKATGGASDKVESSEMVVADGAGKGAGEALWLTPESPELTGLIDEARGTHIAVVTWTAFIDEAKATFKTPLVFTPSEIKGLEYETIVVWRPLTNDDCYRACVKLRPLEGLAQSTRRAKTGYSDESFLPYFNELITAVTRAVRKVVIVQEQKHAINPMIAALREGFLLSSPVVKAKVVQYSDADWEKEAIKLLRLGDDPKALTIFVEKMQRREQDFATFKAKYRQPNTPLAVAASAEIKSAKPHPVMAAAAETKKTPDKAPLPKATKNMLSIMKKSEKAKKLSSADKTTKLMTMLQSDVSCLNDDYVSRWLVDALSSDKASGIDGTFLSYLLVCTAGLRLLSGLMDEYPDIFRAIPSRSWAKPLGRGQDSGVTPIYWLTSMSQGCDILKGLIETYTDMVRGIPSDVWAKPHLAVAANTGAIANTTPLYWLTACAEGCAILKNLIETCPEVLRAIPVDAWARPLPICTGSQANMTPLYWLASSDEGRITLKILLETCPDVVRAIPEEAWSLPHSAAAGTCANTTPLSGLTAKIAGLAILKILIETCPDVVSSISHNAWGLPVSSGAYANITPLYRLVSEDDGCVILKTLIETWPDLVRAIPVDAWARPLSVAAGGYASTSALYWLTRSPVGLSTLMALIETCPDVVRAISVDAWVRPLTAAAGADANRTPLYWLIASIEGLTMLKTLIERCPDVVRSIPVDAWTRPCTETNFSFLYRLTASTAGRATLKILIETCSEVVLAIPHDAWVLLLPYAAGINANSSPLSCLMENSDGRAILKSIKIKLEFLPINQGLLSLLVNLDARDGIETEGPLVSVVTPFSFFGLDEQNETHGVDHRSTSPPAPP